jgi:hypothetical protein
VQHLPAFAPQAIARDSMNAKPANGLDTVRGLFARARFPAELAYLSAEPAYFHIELSRCRVAMCVTRRTRPCVFVENGAHCLSRFTH